MEIQEKRQVENLRFFRPAKNLQHPAQCGSESLPQMFQWLAFFGFTLKMSSCQSWDWTINSQFWCIDVWISDVGQKYKRVSMNRNITFLMIEETMYFCMMNLLPLRCGFNGPKRKLTTVFRSILLDIVGNQWLNKIHFGGQVARHLFFWIWDDGMFLFDGIKMVWNDTSIFL